MNKEEIFEKSKKDNCIADELEIDVDRREKENGYLFLKSILIILFIISSILPKNNSNSFVRPYLFSFLLFARVTSQLITRNYYYKKSMTYF